MNHSICICGTNLGSIIVLGITMHGQTFPFVLG